MKQLYLEKEKPIAIATFYSFTEIREKSHLCSQIQGICEDENLLGTVEVSGEGINCSLSGSKKALARFVIELRKTIPRAQIKPHFSSASEPPFRLLKIKERNELVHPGRHGLSKISGASVRALPSEWDALLADRKVQFLDARNAYEYRIGSFIGARETKINSFAEFANFVVADKHLDKQKPVAIFCTGGIRCEKASLVLENAGFEKIIQLEGGILRYLSDSKHVAANWRGDCFVFDNRVALDYNLEPSNITQCAGCRVPLTAADRKEQHFEEGICCCYCHTQTTREKRFSLAERKRQRMLERNHDKTHSLKTMLGTPIISNKP